MQFIAIVDDQYARVTHFPYDYTATYRYLQHLCNQVLVPPVAIHSSQKGLASGAPIQTQLVELRALPQTP